MLADRLVESVKPPECELDRPTEEPDDSHHILVDVLNPIPGLEDFNPFEGFFQLLIYPDSSFSLICFITTTP